MRDGLAQQIVRLGFSDKYVFAPPTFRVASNENEFYFSDIIECIDIIGGYGDFDPERVKQALYFLLRPGYKISIGREGSPVIYIGAVCLDPEELRKFKEMNKNISAKELELYEGMVKEFEDFNKACEKFSKAAEATEHSFLIESGQRVCRFWWS